MISLIIFVLVLGTIVLVHEVGHFIFAKKVGVHVYEFSIGMGPKIISRTAKDKTIYSLRAIPIGGYVSLAGEEVKEDKNISNGKRLQDKTVFQRFLVMVMGVVFNFIFAFIVFVIIGLISGTYSSRPVISGREGYPAYDAGLVGEAKVLEINGNKVKYLEDINLYISLADLSKEITIKAEQNGNMNLYRIKPIKEGDTYVIGINIIKESTKGIGALFSFALNQELYLFKEMGFVLKNLFTGGLSVNQLSGPVGIYKVVDQTREYGFVAILNLLALLSINVGVINILPLPAFDGGRILFLFIEKIKGSPVNQKVENTIHSIGLICLLLLMLYITFNDILRLF